MCQENKTLTSKDTLSICTWNARGFKTSVPYMRELCSRFDMVLITEHWLHSNRMDEFEQIAENFSYFGRSSQYSSDETYGVRRGQGGVVILWNNKIASVTPIREYVHDRLCAVRLQNTQGAIFNIFCVYFPAKGCCDDLTTTIDELSAIIENTDFGTKNIICGDMNADVGNSCGTRGIRNSTKEGKCLSDFIAKYDLFAANLDILARGPVDTFYGPNGSSSIDYILLPNEMVDKVLTCETLDFESLNGSDHIPVTCTINIGHIKSPNVPINHKKKIRWDKLSPRDMFLKYTIPVETKLKRIIEYWEGHDINKHDLDAIIKEVIDILRECEKAIPVTSFKNHLKPYWCPELDTLKKNKIKCHKAWCSEGRPRDYFHPLKAANRDAKKAFNKRLKALSKAYERNEINEAIRKSEIDRNAFWKLLKKKRAGRKSEISAIKNDKDIAVYDINEILLTWKKHFSTLCTPKNDDNYDNDFQQHVKGCIGKWLEREDDDEFTKEEFTDQEISSAIKDLNSNKAPGYDGATKEHIVSAGKNLVSIIKVIMNRTVALEYIPKNFRKGLQVPIYKGKNLSTLKTDNYRGITLLSVFNKLFEVLIWKRIQPWWRDGKVIANTQGACKKGISSLHTAMLLQESISVNLETNKKVFVLYLDVSKAFDSVWIDGLFYQLYVLGIKGRVWRILYQ